jgi:hypothetical protein
VNEAVAETIRIFREALASGKMSTW